MIGIIGTLVAQKYTQQKKQQVNINKTVNITETNTIKSAINEIYDAVVLVETYDNNSEMSTGTGFVYKTNDGKAYIITNHHVIDGGNKYVITLTNGQEEEAKLLGSDEYSDIAVLSISAEYVTQVAKLGESEKSEIGDTVFAVGSPLGKEYMGTVTKGILSGKNRTVTLTSPSTQQMIEVLQTDTAALRFFGTMPGRYPSAYAGELLSAGKPFLRCRHRNIRQPLVRYVKASQTVVQVHS